MDAAYSQQILEKIEFVFENIAKSGNTTLQQKIEEKKDQIYASIPKSSSQILSNNQNRMHIAQYLDNFVQFVSKEENLCQTKGFFKTMRKHKIAKCQYIFAQKFIKLPKYFKNLENQDMSASGFINDKDVVQCKIPFNFIINSHLLDSEIDYIVCMELIFNDIYNEVIFCHSLNLQRLLKKIPGLKQFEFFQTLEKYLSITVKQEQSIVSLQSMHPLAHFSPVIKSHQNTNQQQFYLHQDMEIIISPSYKIKVIKMFYNQFEILTENFIRKTKKQQYDSKLLIQNASNYIVLQPLEDKIDHELITIYDLKQSIILDKFLKLPNEISIQLSFDGIGFLIEVLKENKNFYTSLLFKEDVHCITKNLQFCIVIRNELRIQIDSTGGELFVDKNDVKSTLFFG